MTEATFNRRLQQLVNELTDHPYREEIMKLAESQLVDDTVVLSIT